MAAPEHAAGPSPSSLFESTTFEKDVSIKVPDEGVGAASISPSGRDVVLAGKSGLLILDLDNPYSPPRHIIHKTDWDVADVQWSPFASRADRIATTANQKALIFNLGMSSAAHKAPIEYTLHSHERAITDINFAAHHPDVLATCAVDSFVLTWDLRTPWSSTAKFGMHPSYVVADFEAGATQVKWNRKNEYIMASSHDKFLLVWDTRKGAVPVTKIAAHQTKIYGIDWHRTDSTRILTCSLDKSIKLWNEVSVVQEITEPERVIHTNHPIWRARHTPFPNGILAMPQRGSSALSLYPHSAGTRAGDTTVTREVHTFQAHEDDARVQEFLWRVRGSADEGFDNREFQLISWGTDKHLHLYTVSSDRLFNSVGFQKGMPVLEKPSSTRKGAKYITYRDDPPKQSQRTRLGQSNPSIAQQGALSSLFQSNSQLDFLSSTAPGSIQPRSTMTAGTIRHSSIGRVINTIQWMEGVKVGERRVAAGPKDPTSTTPGDQYRWTVRDDLAAEVSHVGNTYSKVNFESVEIGERRVTVSFQGPWGDADNSTERKGERKLTFLRLSIAFPQGYPHLTRHENTESEESMTKLNPLHIEFQKTTAAIDDDTLSKLKDDLYEIADHRAAHGREALEAVICYALGERTLEDSLVIPGEPDDFDGAGDLLVVESTQDSEMITPEDPDLGESSSDDDDDDAGLGLGQDAMNSSLSNANIPVPIQCSTRFSVSGKLVVVRVPSKDPTLSAISGLARFPRHGTEGLTRNEIFESFGRLNIPNEHHSESPPSSEGSWEWSSSPSSSSSSGSDNEPDVPQSRFQPPKAWQNPALRFQSKTSHPSSIAASKANKAKSSVSILLSAAEEFVPNKRCLAEGYRIFGDGPQVCSHNAEIARRSGYNDLADIWELCKLILNNEVPLEILPQNNRREQVLVLARRALVRIKRKDSGLDLQFDEADNVTNPKLRGRIKWGHHAIVTWLIPALFDHFEKLADTQMLAMLSCIFCEPAAREGVTSAMSKTRQSNLPMSMAAPAFSLDYFASADAAWSLFRSSALMASTSARARYSTANGDFSWHRLTKPFDTYGSHNSSSGPWGSDLVPSDLTAPYSTGNTPPALSRVPTNRSTTTHTPFSASPEQSHVSKRSSTANFASAFASLSRPFANAISSSPPVKRGNEGDLSTSAPTSGVTWGTTTFYSSGSNERSLAPVRTKHGKRASFGQADRLNIDYYSDSDSDYDDGGIAYDGASEYTGPILPGSEDDAGSVRVTLKNQNLFDDEACASAPLLDMSKEWLYRAWREQYAEMLGSWGLVTKRAEVLKFNGLVSYFPLEDSRSSSKAGSMHLALLRPEVESLKSTPLSRTSTNLLPPPLPGVFRRSPSASPRHFSFNPEAVEFRPGSELDSDIPAPPPDVFMSSEQYLRLSMPTPAPAEIGEDDSVDTNPFDSVLHSKMLKPRPGFSRTISKNSSIEGRARREPIYSCSICWIRVSGRFFLCPACGHVAHFACMDFSGDESLGLGATGEDGGCVVGCGCGCGFEGEDEDLQLGKEGLRVWDEKGGWFPVVGGGPEANAGMAAHMGTWVDKVSSEKQRSRLQRGLSAK